MNEVKLDGALVRDIDLKYVKNGELALLKNAIKNTYKDKAEYINIIAWREVAEEIANTCSKGSEIAIEGRIQTGSYTKQDGTKVYTTDVVVNKVVVANPLTPIEVPKEINDFDNFEDTGMEEIDGDSPF